jgi:hypothetical protein
MSFMDKRFHFRKNNFNPPAQGMAKGEIGKETCRILLG